MRLTVDLTMPSYDGLPRWAKVKVGEPRRDGETVHISVGLRLRPWWKLAVLLRALPSLRVRIAR